MRSKNIRSFWIRLYEGKDEDIVQILEKKKKDYLAQKSYSGLIKELLRDTK